MTTDGMSGADTVSVNDPNGETAGKADAQRLPESLSLALAVYQTPSQFAELLHGKADLPDDIGLLLRLAGGAPLPEDIVLPPFSAPEDVRPAAQFFIEQILLAHDANHYRVLGTRPTASPEELKINHRLLMRLYHPDRHVLEGLDTDRQASHAARINLAYTNLHSPAARSAYDLSLRQAQQARQTITPAAPLRATRRRHSTTPAAPLLPPWAARHLPQLVLAGFALLAVAAVGLVYLNRTPSGAIGAGDDFAQQPAAVIADASKPAQAQHHDNQQIEYLKQLATTGQTMPMPDAPALTTPTRLVSNAETAAAADETPTQTTKTANTLRDAADTATMKATTTLREVNTATTLAVAAVAIPAATPVAAPVATRNAASVATTPAPTASTRPATPVSAPAQPTVPAAATGQSPPAPHQPTRPAVAPPMSSPSPASLPATAPMATVATVPPPGAAAAAADDGTENLGGLLDALSILYEKGDLEAFLALFDENARIENGGKAHIRNDYDNLFRDTHARKLTIYNMNWVKDGSTYRGQGSFQARVLSRNSSTPRIYNGTITLEVVRNSSAFLIRGMYHKMG
ncbi:MAG: DnaJ domain-containing protein [Sterolibacterium sp.]|nr:DnaJ domain-containing protein [Sterolibacterium sp.]